MSFQIHLYPSDLTPPPGPFLTLVAEVLASRGAVWEDEEHGELRLSDETEIGLFTDEEENVAVFVLDDQNEAAFDIVYDIADRSASFITVGELACATPSAGDVLPGHDALYREPDDLKGRPEVGDWLRVALRAAAPPPDARPASQSSAGPIVGGPQRSLFQRLSDALFGKSI